MRVEADESQNGTYYSHLHATERQKPEESLEEFSDVFNERPERTKRCEHAIDTGTAAPVKIRPRRMLPQWRKRSTHSWMRCLIKNCVAHQSLPGRAMSY